MNSFFKTALFPFAFCIVNSSFSFSQNLVPNSSFEDTISCPQGIGEITKSIGWMETRNSPDYYNSCNNNFFCVSSGTFGCVGVPVNWLGHQAAFHGNAYAGIITWFAPSVREFMSVQLTQPLVSGTKYFASAYISRVDIGEISPNTCSCNKFGFRFSSIAYNGSTNPAPVDNFSHVHSDSIVTDTSNWTRIAGSFVADSAYKYLTIGNFYDDAHTDTSACNYPQANVYYYVDAVCVSVDSLSCSTWTAINEPVIYSNETRIYPNPAGNILYFENLNLEVSYTLTDVAGKRILYGKVNRKENYINISSIEDGVYFLNTEIKHFKFLIIH